jgi:ABC-type lipoprotein release transport system permease subunit
MALVRTILWSAAVALVMVAIATLATIVPATRAARVDPVVILKTE